eukprot:1196339-Prorocentrum_minimum.AAC.1
MRPTSRHTRLRLVIGHSGQGDGVSAEDPNETKKTSAPIYRHWSFKGLDTNPKNGWDVRACPPARWVTGLGRVAERRSPPSGPSSHCRSLGRSPSHKVGRQAGVTHVSPSRQAGVTHVSHSRLSSVTHVSHSGIWPRDCRLMRNNVKCSTIECYTCDSLWATVAPGRAAASCLGNLLRGPSKRASSFPGSPRAAARQHLIQGAFGVIWCDQLHGNT